MIILLPDVLNPEVINDFGSSMHALLSLMASERLIMELKLHSSSSSSYRKSSVGPPRLCYGHFSRCLSALVCIVFLKSTPL